MSEASADVYRAHLCHISLPNLGLARCTAGLSLKPSPCSHRTLSSTKPPPTLSFPSVCADVPLVVHMDWESVGITHEWWIPHPGQPGLLGAASSAPALTAATALTGAVPRFCSRLTGLLLLISSQGHCKSEFVKIMSITMVCDSSV